MPPVVKLRQVEPDDLPTFHEQQSDTEAAAIADVPPRERDDFMAHWHKILADPTVMTRTILADDAVAGTVVSWSHDDEREVGYWIGRKFWGRRIGTTAVSSFLGLDATRPLVAYISARNAASRRVIEKCGFAFVGEVDLPARVGPPRRMNQFRLG